MSVATDLAHEQAVLERRVEQAEQAVATAKFEQRQAEQRLKQEQFAGRKAQQRLAKETIEAATALLVASIATYIGTAPDPQFARQCVQTFLAARVVPVIGAEIPPLPFGADSELK